MALWAHCVVGVITVAATTAAPEHCTALLVASVRVANAANDGQPESDPRLAAMVTNLAPQVLLQQATTAGG